jgi:hypothetical protein
MTKKHISGIGLVLAIFLICAFSSTALAGYNAKLFGSAEESGSNGLLQFSTFQNERCKAIFTSAATLDGRARSETMSFLDNGNFLAGSAANANGCLSDTDSFTYVDGSHIGTIATATVRGAGSAYASSRVTAASER